MKITDETVRDIARLANLQFSEAEQATLVTQLGSVLGHIEKISELKLDHVNATSRLQQPHAPLRMDQLKPSLGTQQALANAPDKEGDHFLVPKVIKVK